MVPTDPIGELTDEPLAQEIDLLSELMQASAGAGRVLTDAEIDEALGL